MTEFKFSLCNYCYCMTKTIKGKCGKCGRKKGKYCKNGMTELERRIREIINNFCKKIDKPLAPPEQVNEVVEQLFEYIEKTMNKEEVR